MVQEILKSKKFHGIGIEKKIDVAVLIASGLRTVAEHSARSSIHLLKRL